MTVKVVTAPTTEPITLTEAKLHCRVDETADDALITGLITVAREEVERRSWFALMPQTLELILEEWPDGTQLELPRPPLISVTSVKYKDEDGTETTWGSSNYIVDADSVPGRIALANGVSWASGGLYAVGAIRVRYTAGYANAAAVPQSLKQAMLLLVGHWYENREAVVIGTITKSIEFAVDALCESYRRMAMTA